MCNSCNCENCRRHRTHSDGSEAYLEYYDQAEPVPFGSHVQTVEHPFDLDKAIEELNED